MQGTAVGKGFDPYGRDATDGYSLTAKVTTALAPGASVPMLAVILPAEPTAGVGVAMTPTVVAGATANTVKAGVLSETVTPVASAVPKFCTVIW